MLLPWFLGAYVLLRGNPKPLFGVTFLGLLAASGVLLMEGFLRVSPGILQGEVANGAYSGYHCLAGGIYQRDEHLGNRLRPNLCRQIHWNGHWWTHRTNEAGYRGDLVQKVDAVFLGDSMIYGHGVEEFETVSSRYAEMAGKSTANLGQQATCMVQSLARFQELGLDMRPSWVFICCHPNDIGETGIWYPPEELSKFVAADRVETFLPLVREKFQPRSRWNPAEYWNGHLAFPLRTGGAIKSMLRGVAKHGWSVTIGQGIGRLGSASEPPGPGMVADDLGKHHVFVPSRSSLEEVLAPPELGGDKEQSRAWQVHVRAIERIQAQCARVGARLVLYDIGYPYSFTHAMESIAESRGITYSPAGRVVLERALAGDAVYLANDGHWSAEGNRRVAIELKRTVDSLAQPARFTARGVPDAR
ncbi:MAG: hypothetical protein U1D30_08975 [Planctomycetota bacterium]